MLLISFRKNSDSLAISLLFVGLSSVPFLVRTVTAGDKVYSIRVLEIPSLNKELRAMPNNDQNQRPPSSTNQQLTVPKPVPPPNEFIKEHTVPPSTTERIIHEQKE